MVETRQREHAQRVKENRDAQRQPAKADEEHGQAADVQHEEGDGANPIDFLAGFRHGRILNHWRAKPVLYCLEDAARGRLLGHGITFARREIESLW